MYWVYILAFDVIRKVYAHVIVSQSKIGTKIVSVRNIYVESFNESRKRVCSYFSLAQNQLFSS